MPFLIIDTETSGLFNFKDPADAPGQPRMASFAGLAVNDPDDEPEVFERYIRPDGWQMDPKAGAVNGLTDEFLAANGVPVAEVLDEYVRRIEAGYVIVAFNAQFDLKMMRAELRRAGRDDLFERTPNICVMRPLTDVLQLPGRFGFKWPNLAEACAHYGITNAKAHDAVGDAWAALEVMRNLRRDGLLPEAKVHYSKGGKA